MKKVKRSGVMLLLAIAGIFTSAASINSTTAAPIIPPGRCICTDIYKPVCIIATGQQFPNACHAACAGYTPKDWYDCSAM